MARETVEDRAARLLLEHRLNVTFVKGEVIAAEARGTGAIHAVAHEPGLGWTCTCEAGAHHHRCAHVAALQRVVVPIRTDR